MSYCVYLKRKQTLPLEPVARLIAAIPGLTLADGQQMVRRCRGFLIEHLELGDAEKLVQELKSLGVTAESRQIRELASNPPAIYVRAARFNPETYTVQDWRSQESTYLWEDVILMSVCGLKELEVPEPLKKNLKPDGFPEAIEDEKPDGKTKIDWLLDFYVDQPRLHFRIRSDEFRYDYLGDRLQRSSVANFASMLQDLEKYGLNAHKDDGFAAALDARWGSVQQFTAVYEVDEYHRWLLQAFSSEPRRMEMLKSLKK